MLEFDIPMSNMAQIKVIGVGGGGNNAVDRMIDDGLDGVDFISINTDGQALAKSKSDTKIQIGEKLTKGLGAGGNPEIGEKSVDETQDEIAQALRGSDMVFITAGMGGGTGTGAAPVIAKAARDRGILTVGIVTLPLRAEGRKRIVQAEAGLEELRKNVDSFVVIHTENISKIYGQLPLEEAFKKADDILATAAKGIAELITNPGYVNVDFADVKTVLSNGGMALMGSAHASGADENRVAMVTEEALSSPLFNRQDIKGAKNILINLSYSPGLISMEDTTYILETIQRKANKGVGDVYNSDIIWGAASDPSLNNEIVLTIVATGFDAAAQAVERQPQHAGGIGMQPRTGSKLSAAMPPKQQTSTIDIKKSNRFGNLEEYLKRPAYMRRNIRLVNISKTSKVSIKDDGKPASPKAEDADLFGKRQ